MTNQLHRKGRLNVPQPRADRVGGGRGGAPGQAGSERARRFRNLNTVGGILTELGRVYRAGWSGALEWQDAACAARILREIRITIEGGELEQRLERLEEHLSVAKPNGHDRRELRQ